MRLRLALFDLDGTLVDSQAHIVGAMGAAFDAVGRTPPPRDEILGQVGLSLPLVMARLAPGDDHATMLAAYKDRYQVLRAAGPANLYPGIGAALNALHARDTVLVGIATGASRGGMTAMIDTHDLRPATAQCADDHPSKPAPSMVLAALAETGVDPDDAVMIGDSAYDMQMARSAGVFALGVAWGYHAPDQLRDAGAAEIVADAAELVPALDRYWRTSDG
ncbi:HAD-IA family hydrolase [Palleronia abyssalis]|uniref:Pyrophosphatase PpaX n=1 Tax=Palleronia abyssalis TaxID=1501240 RepID=A0A2R8BXY6_9RHOB|nr:HAD-IA family hydrolase [Palleronia abyssalis]SPJ24992.1 Pyrophosphatase PpaX [Palleronia abyssalis]